jgi:hypothetical protein
MAGDGDTTPVADRAGDCGSPSNGAPTGRPFGGGCYDTAGKDGGHASTGTTVDLDLARLVQGPGRAGPVPRLRSGAESDGMNSQQRIVVWVVASVLSVASVVNGIIRSQWGLAASGFGYRFEWKPDSIFWFVILPVLLIGAATFLHFMRRKARG